MRINSYRPQTYLGGGEQKISTAQQYTNATQNDLRSQMRSHAIRAHGKESFGVHRADNSCGKLRQRPCQPNSMDIKKAFAKHFPNIKLIHAFRNSRGKIHLEFDSADTAVDIMQNWNKDAMGTDSSVTNPRGKHRQNALFIYL